MYINGLIIVLIIIVLYFVYNKYNKESIVLSTIKNRHNTKSIKKLKRKTKNREKTKNKYKYKTKQNDDLVFFDIGINGKKIGKIIIILFSDVVPYTCKNFRELCRTKKYKKSPFHRIINNFMVQGGDFTKGNGTGGISIYGEKFEDENFDIPHDRPYLLSMANSGPDTNGSQFFITTSETPHLDGKHVVFGEVIKGFNIINELNEMETDENDRPIDNINILNCGIV